MRTPCIALLLGLPLLALPACGAEPAPGPGKGALVTFEICDGCPADIEADTAYWLGTVRRFCAWGASVTRITRIP